MKILVCGGAGYIGSHAVLGLVEAGHEVLVADNLEKGHRGAVHRDAELFVGDLRDTDFLSRVFKENKIDAVMDFAAYSLVGESCTNPYKYFGNNVAGTLNLLKSMQEHDVNHLVFSSTAAVYGEPENIPILETDKTESTNPYGESKLMVEKMLKWGESAHGLKYAALRYFNVAGADESGKIGEDHSPETHLIPLVLKAAKTGGTLKVFGDDYPTEDGTCIRDYVHVTDLVHAHILALDSIIKQNESKVYNIGNGKGFSVLDIIHTAEKVTGLNIKYEVVGRRPGDPSILVASSEKITKEGFRPKYNSLEKIIETAWIWHKNFPDGFHDKWSS